MREPNAQFVLKELYFHFPCLEKHFIIKYICNVLLSLIADYCFSLSFCCFYCCLLVICGLQEDGPIFNSFILTNLFCCLLFFLIKRESIGVGGGRTVGGRVGKR